LAPRARVAGCGANGMRVAWARPLRRLRALLGIAAALFLAAMSLGSGIRISA
jgi:hypothetical protein